MPGNQRPDPFQQAVWLFQQGRAAEAEPLLGQVPQRHPNHVDALHLLAIIAQDSSRTRRAAALLGRAIKLRPTAAALHDDLARAQLDLGQHAGAVASADAAVRLDPAFIEAWINRGNILRALGRPDDAIASYDRALALDPGFAVVHFNRALACAEVGRHAEAVAEYDRVIALDPGFADAFVSRGASLAQLRRPDEAMASLRQAIALRPDHAEAHYNMGTVLLDLGQHAEAIGPLRRAVALRPDHAEAHRNLGIALREIGRFAEALESVRAAVTLHPDDASLLGEIVQLRLMLCDWRDIAADIARMVAAIGRGGAASPPFPVLLTSDDPAVQRQAAAAFATRRYPEDRRPPRPEANAPHDRIRIGYFSADFRDHPVSTLTLGLLEQHDPRRFQVTAFSFAPTPPDAVTRRVAAACERFVDVGALPDAAVADLAREAEIDIAIDLGGFTRHARTGIFAARAAPVQVNYIGYPGTMGANYYDYILADRVVIPATTRGHYAEKVVYLPSYQCGLLDTPAAAPPRARAEAGLPAHGFVFCCFNNHLKITPGMFASWMAILRGTGDSVLWLYSGNDAASRNILAAAAGQGVDPGRVVIAGRVPRAAYLDRMRLADVFLDTAPYNAGATASDALSVGLPVLTLRGASFAGRMGASLLTTLGLPALIAESRDAYERIAITLAREPVRLAGLRHALGAHRHGSGLFDPVRFTRGVEAAYTAMHERARAGLAPDHIDMPQPWP